MNPTRRASATRLPPGGGGSRGERDPYAHHYALITGTSDPTEDGKATYLGHEVVLDYKGTPFRPALSWEMTADAPGVSMDGSVFQAGDIALARLGPGAGGELWELTAFGASAAAAAGNCSLHVRKADCVSFTTAAGASSVATWDAAAGGWPLPMPVTTGDGPAAATLLQDDFNRYVVKLVTENAPAGWYLNPTGRCDRAGATVFRGDYLPLALQEEPSGSGSGSGVVVPCADETITLALKCVACSMSCGEYGPFPATMCVVTPDTAANPDATPDPAANCSFYYGIAFDPVTVVFGAPGAAWGASGADYPATVGGASLANVAGTTAFPEHDVPVRWFGKGTLTHSSGAYSYGVEIWFDEDCGPNITYYLPVVEFPGTPGVMHVKLRAFTLPFGTPAAFPELPPVGAFPVVVPAGSVLPYQVGADQSGAAADPCPHGVVYPVNYPTVGRWAYGSAGTFDLGPAVVHSGGCADVDDGGGGANPSCCSGEGEPLEREPGADLPGSELTVPDGPLAGTYPSTNSGAAWGFNVSGTGALVFCTTLGWAVRVSGPPVVEVAAAAASCSPFGLVFPGAAFGSAGDVTLELA